jgi:hypothetical protein
LQDTRETFIAFHNKLNKENVAEKLKGGDEVTRLYYSLGMVTGALCAVIDKVKGVDND